MDSFPEGSSRATFCSAQRVVSLALAAAILAAPLFGQGAPMAGGARVSAVPAAEALVGSSVPISLRVDLSSVTGRSPSGAVVPAVLGAYQIRVSFDNTRLRFDSATGGSADGFVSAPVYTMPDLANASGVVTLTAAQTGASAPTGLAAIAVLNFQALNQGVAALNPAVVSLASALQQGPPAVGLVSIPGSATASSVPVNVSSGSLAPQQIAIDPSAGPSSNGNGVLEPGEQAVAVPSWKNVSADSLSVSGQSQGFSGPAGPAYGVGAAAAGYGAIPAGASRDCFSATGNCYVLTVSLPATRPAPHWDAYFTESASTGDVKTWRVHVGASFTDVPTAHLFYRPVETIFHNGITGGCGGTGFCPDQLVTRAQMAVFLLKGKLGSAYVPPLASGTRFTDVAFADFAAGWIEDLANRGITSGCGNGKYCPGDPVTRASMAVLLLRMEHGPAYSPPAAVGTFSDVPASDPFAKWVEQLAREGITGGCGSGKFCPGTPVSRGQMAAFLARTFQLSL